MKVPAPSLRRGLSIPDGKLKQKIGSRQEGIRRGLHNAASEKGDAAIKKTFATLFASTVLAAGIGLPAWSAMHGAVLVDGSRPAALFRSPKTGAMPVLVSDEEDGGRDHRRSLRTGGDDDEHDEGDDDEGDDDDDDNSSYGGNASGPAPAGSVVPPQNGLFGNGTAPKAQVN